MIPELIRYICCVIHPTNEILGSDILPRWAVVGWLLSLCQVSKSIFEMRNSHQVPVNICIAILLHILAYFDVEYTALHFKFSVVNVIIILGNCACNYIHVQCLSQIQFMGVRFTWFLIHIKYVGYVDMWNGAFECNP